MFELLLLQLFWLNKIYRWLVFGIFMKNTLKRLVEKKWIIVFKTKKENVTIKVIWNQ